MKLSDEQIDALWLNRTNLHGGEIIPQLRDFARKIERLAAIPAKEQPDSDSVHLTEPAEGTVPVDALARVREQLSAEIESNREVARLLLSQDREGSLKWARGLVLRQSGSDPRFVAEVDQPAPGSQADTDRPRSDEPKAAERSALAAAGVNPSSNEQENDLG